MMPFTPPPQCDAISRSPAIIKGRDPAHPRCVRRAIGTLHGYNLCDIHRKNALRERSPVLMRDGKYITREEVVGEARYRLFAHMANEYHATLLESELDELIELVMAVVRADEREAAWRGKP